MIRTASTLYLAGALALAVTSNSGLAANAVDGAQNAPAPAQVKRVQSLKRKLTRLAVDPATLIAGAVRCTCLHDLLFPPGTTVKVGVINPAPLLGPQLASPDDSFSVRPALIEDKLGVRIDVRW